MKDDAEREAFERFFNGQLNSPMVLERGKSGHYIDTAAHRMWTAWQARAALSARADGGKDSLTEAELTALSIAIGSLKREGFREDAEVLKKLRTRLSLANGGKGAAVSDGAQNFACYLIDHCEGETVREESILTWLGKMLSDLQYTAPQAECAPREAELHTALSDLVDAITQNVQVTRALGFARDALAAPTPERADMKGFESRLDATNPDIAEIRAALQSEFSPIFPELQERADADAASSVADAAMTDEEAYALWTKIPMGCSVESDMGNFARAIYDEMMRKKSAKGLATLLFGGESSDERADAEKDAALTDAEIDAIWLDTPGGWRAFARAILVAKEKKS